MQRLLSIRAGATLIAAGTFLVTHSGARAQDKEKTGEEIQFETADKVELRGKFYASKKSKAPCAILLHNLGGNRQQKGWEDLAEKLSNDFAVLSFDFRGHGDSTNVDPVFWKTSANMMIRGAAKMPSKISFKDFPDAYYPMLVNDIVAAKRYLEQQNDAGACNASNIVVIGAQDGAAIGALWIAAEWKIPKLTKNAFGVYVSDPSNKVAGEDIAAAVWLSIPRKSRYAGNRDVLTWMTGQGSKVRDKVPMVFFYGKEDQQAASAATALLAELKRAGKEKLDLTGTREKDGKFAGVDLLGKKSLDTEEDISGYLVQRVLARGTRPWVMRKPEDGAPFTLIPLNQFGFNLR
jgi:alpha-beta hydrolase superfamily lysophospholipase